MEATGKIKFKDSTLAHVFKSLVLQHIINLEIINIASCIVSVVVCTIWYRFDN